MIKVRFLVFILLLSGRCLASMGTEESRRFFKGDNRTETFWAVVDAAVVRENVEETRQAIKVAERAFDDLKDIYNYLSIPLLNRGTIPGGESDFHRICHIKKLFTGNFYLDRNLFGGGVIMRNPTTGETIEYTDQYEEVHPCDERPWVPYDHFGLQERYRKNQEACQKYPQGHESEEKYEDSDEEAFVQWGKQQIKSKK